LEKNDACEILSTKLEEMQASRRLDETAIPMIKQAINESIKREESWLSNKNLPTQSAFVLYHASRNTRMILEKMLNRFMLAAQRHENPKVVDDAMVVFPELHELCGYIDSLKADNLSGSFLEFIKKRVRALRNTADRVGMLPTTEEEVTKVKRVLRNC
jgi:hypothetical protein